MPATIKKKTFNPTRMIDLGADGSFSVTVRRPTWDEFREAENLEWAASRNTIDGAWGLLSEHRIRCIVIGWSELFDESGNAIEFSWEALTALCLDCRAAFDQLDLVAMKLFAGLTEEREKNSERGSSALPVPTPAASQP